MIAQSNSNLLRWLLRRGSPLPIPNRVVKPVCADGTAVMWESMSSPFFNLNLFSDSFEPQPEKVGVLFFYFFRKNTIKFRPNRVGNPALHPEASGVLQLYGSPDSYRESSPLPAGRQVSLILIRNDGDFFCFKFF